MFKYVLASALLVAAPAFAGETVQQTMSFSECAQTVQQAQNNPNTPITITVETADRKEAVVTVPDGQLTIVCDGTTNQATMTHN